MQKQARFRQSDIGLPANPVKIEGCPSQQSGDEVTLNLAIPARGHLLLKVWATNEERPAPKD